MRAHVHHHPQQKPEMLSVVPRFHLTALEVGSCSAATYAACRHGGNRISTELKASSPLLEQLKERTVESPLLKED